MNISQAFDQQPWADKLKRRRLNFKEMCVHMEQKVNIGHNYIVETGTAWDKGNFQFQGQSTIIWDWFAKLFPSTIVHSIDIRPEASLVAKEQTSRVTYEIGDSVKALSNFEWPNKIGLLYLDSFDWTEELNFQSAFHHMKELAAIYAWLPESCMIVVDDRHGDGRGKHHMVEEFFKNLDVKPIFKNHQIGWLKPRWQHVTRP